jgi:serine/threonine-protein kinase
MPINILGYMLGRLTAERAGVSDTAAINRLALVGAILPSPLMGAVVTQQLAIREAANSQPPSRVPEPSPAPSPDPAPVPVFIPDVRRQSLEDAQRILLKYGLHATVKTNAPAVVAEQSPAPGAQVDPGATVTLTVLTGTTVPDVTGKPLSTAKDNLYKLGFSVHVEKQFDSAAPENQVIMQSPGPGEQVPERSQVTLTISAQNTATFPRKTDKADLVSKE